jgi:hypothetical protein
MGATRQAPVPLSDSEWFTHRATSRSSPGVAVTSF